MSNSESPTRVSERQRIEKYPCPTCGAVAEEFCKPLTADAVKNFSGQRYCHAARIRLANHSEAPVKIQHTGWPVGRSPGA